MHGHVYVWGNTLSIPPERNDKFLQNLVVIQYLLSHVQICPGLDSAGQSKL